MESIGPVTTVWTRDDIQALAKSVVKEVQRTPRRESGAGIPELGLVIKQHRVQKGWNQRELARQTDLAGSYLDHTYISKLEAGDRGVSIDSLTRLTHALGTRFLTDYIAAYAKHLEATS